MTGRPVIRVKATRPEFRRAGFVFGSAAWREFAESELSMSDAARMIAEPVLLVEFRRLDAVDWRRATPGDRAMAVEYLEELSADPPADSETAPVVIEPIVAERVAEADRAPEAETQTQLNTAQESDAGNAGAGAATAAPAMSQPAPEAAAQAKVAKPASKPKATAAKRPAKPKPATK